MIELLSAEELAKYPTILLPEMADTQDAASCAHCEGFRPDPQRSGNLQVDPEIHLPSPGMNVDIDNYYNAASTTNAAFGYGRTVSTNLTAQASGSPLLVTLTRANGALVSYQYDGVSAYIAKTPGVLNTLVRDNTNSLWKESTLDGVTTAYPLDTSGHVTTVSWVADAVGNTHTFAYSSGLLSTLQDAVGRKVTFSYSGGLLQSIEDWAGRFTSFAYDTVTASPKNLLTTLTGPTGCQTVYQYSTFTLAGGTSDWLLSGIIDPNGYGTSYTYDQQRRVVTRTIQGVGVTTYLYQPGLMWTVDALGHPTTQTTGGSFSLSGLTDAGGEMTSFT